MRQETVLSQDTIDYDAINKNQEAAWSLGDYQPIALQTYDMNEALVRAVDPRPTEHVLDVACGSGNGVLVAGRRDCEVTGVDLIPAWIDRARKRADVEGVDAAFHVADVQDLPFPDASFDVVFSALGVIFAPNQEQAASELLRVCKPGGKIGLMSHAEGGVVDQMFAALAPYAPPPPPGLRSPIRWGTEEGIRELLGAGTTSIDNQHFEMFVYARSVEHQVDLFQNYYGPTVNLFNNVPEDKQEEVHNLMVDLLQRFNEATDGTMALGVDYQQTVAIRA